MHFIQQIQEEVDVNEMFNYLHCIINVIEKSFLTDHMDAQLVNKTR